MEAARLAAATKKVEKAQAAEAAAESEAEAPKKGKGRGKSKGAKAKAKASEEPEPVPKAPVDKEGNTWEAVEALLRSLTLYMCI